MSNDLFLDESSNWFRYFLEFEFSYDSSDDLFLDYSLANSLSESKSMSMDFKFKMSDMEFPHYSSDLPF